jgi:hypothetical protein
MIQKKEISNIINVSSKRDIKYYLEKCLKYFYNFDQIELHSIGISIPLSLAVCDKLCNDKFAKWVKLTVDTI